MLKLTLLAVLGAMLVATSHGQRRQVRPQPALKSSEPLPEEQLRPKVYEIRSDVSPNIGDGNFKYYVETSDGLHAEQEGYINKPGPSQSQVHQGSYTTFDEEGKIVTINYVADKHGFQPAPESLPTSPPLPEEHVRAREEILRAQKQIRENHLNYFRSAHTAALGQPVGHAQ